MAKTASEHRKTSRICRALAVKKGGEEYRALIPQPLPPDPPMDLTGLYDLNDRASRALGQLDSLATLLPNADLFLSFYVMKEALLSSQIEGTQSSFSDLLYLANDVLPAERMAEAQDVSNYVAAMTYGLKRHEAGFPISLRLIREVHAVLLRSGRGADKDPGEFRRSQNWVGGTRPGNAIFVPPPPEHLEPLLDLFEKFLHDREVKLPLLVRMALAHLQFETIHPFLDGNGRLGRLLITFMLCAEGALKTPLLYLSLYFKSNRDRYYDLLQRVRVEGVWEEWCEFFLAGVLETALGAAASARRILTIFEEDRACIQASGRKASTMLRVHDHMQRHPLIWANRLSTELRLTGPTVRTALASLAGFGIVAETTGRYRNRVYAYTRYLGELSKGAEPNVPAGR